MKEFKRVSPDQIKPGDIISGSGSYNCKVDEIKIYTKHTGSAFPVYVFFCYFINGDISEFNFMCEEINGKIRSQEQGNKLKPWFKLM